MTQNATNLLTKNLIFMQNICWNQQNICEITRNEKCSSSAQRWSENVLKFNFE